MSTEKILCETSY